MQNYRNSGTVETYVVKASETVTKNNLVALDTGDVKEITNGAACHGVALTTGAAGESVSILRKDVVIDVKAAAGVALTQGDVVYATGVIATSGGRSLPEVDAGASGEISIGVVYGGDIATAGVGKVRLQITGFSSPTTHA